jgi:ketosteroid isomerase-like protein
VSQENIELVETFLEAWRLGSLADSDLLHPRAEWVNPPDAIERGVRTGDAAFVSAAEAVRAAFEDAQIDLDRLIGAGDRVAGVGVLRGRGRESGVQIERSLSLIWTIVDRRIVRLEWFFGHGEALEAAERWG